MKFQPDLFTQSAYKLNLRVFGALENGSDSWLHNIYYLGLFRSFSRASAASCIYHAGFA